MWFKNGILPKSLFRRFFLIIVIPTILIQVVVGYIFYDRHWKSVREVMVSSMVENIVFLVETYKSEKLLPNDTDITMFNRIKHFIFNNKVSIHKKIDSHDNKGDSIIHQNVKQRLEELLQHEVSIYKVDDRSDLLLEIDLGSEILEISFSYKRLDTPTTGIFYVWMICSAIVFVTIAIIISSNQIQSIESLSQAAEEFGKGNNVDHFKPRGAIEVKKAGNAFLMMKERIERQMAQRTEILAGVSHDLKTILTRLKLQIFIIKPTNTEFKNDLEDMQNDIEEMEYMIQEYLDFAKGAGIEKAERVNMQSYISQIVDQTMKGYPNIILNFENQIDVFANIRMVSLKRSILNILKNAIRHATRINIKTSTHRNNIHIAIEDNGPGIPHSERDNVFKPFYRIDSARNLQTGGAGLGMAITKDIINSHGGKIVLQDSHNLGGLKVLLVIPY